MAGREEAYLLHFRDTATTKVVALVWDTGIQKPHGPKHQSTLRMQDYFYVSKPAQRVDSTFLAAAGSRHLPGPRWLAQSADGGQSRHLT